MKPRPASAVVCVLLYSAALLSCGGSGVTNLQTTSLAQIEISPANKSIAKGTSVQLSAMGILSNGTQTNLTSSVTWQVSPSSVASINAQGELFGASQGVAQVSAAYQGVTGNDSITVGPPVLIHISVNPPEPVLPTGESEQLAATGKFSDGSTANVTNLARWQATPSTVASVSASGDFKGLSKGTTQVSATYQGLTGTTSVTVASAALLSITVTTAQSSLPVGESEALVATGEFSDGSIENLTNLAAWHASPSGVASVSSSGDLKGLSKGVTQVSAVYQGVTGTASVTVASAALLGITVTTPHSSLPVGESEQLAATGNLSDGSTKNLTDLAQWQASPAGVASVAKDGDLKATSKGRVEVSAAYQGVTGTALITVANAALLSISITAPHPSLPLGESEQLVATGNFSDGSTQNLTQSVVWNSSSPAVASVDSSGRFAANGIGESTVRATSGPVTGTANLTVTAAVMVALSVSPAQTSMLIGNNRQLRAISTYSDGTTKTAPGAAWISEQPEIVAVSNRGMTTGERPGSATITATMNGISGSASVTVMPLMMVSYFDRANDADSGHDTTLQLTNPGFTSGDLCAMVYVLDRSQVLSECCSCKISGDGLLTLSLIHNLTANPLTGKKPVAGTIEIAPSDPGGSGTCDAGSLAPDGVLLAWETNLQNSSGASHITEIPYATTALADSEVQTLALECSAIQQLGSGAGICSCSAE